MDSIWLWLHAKDSSSNFWDLSHPHGMKLIFYLSLRMAILYSNFHPMDFVASLGLLHVPMPHLKKKFLKLVKRHAKQTPKTIGRIVNCLYNRKYYHNS